MEKISQLLIRAGFIRIVLLLLLFNAVLFILLVSPQRAKIADLQVKSATYHMDVVKKQRELRNLQDRRDKLEQAKKDLDYIYTQVLLPKRTGVISIRQELEALVRELNIEREDVSYNYNLMEDLNLREVRFSVPVEGTYVNIRKFINRIERSDHFLILEGVNLSSVQRSDLLNLNFQLSTLLVQDETELLAPVTTQATFEKGSQ